MQAIISDIFVTGENLSSGLQISKDLTNIQNSSNQVSFADLLRQNNQSEKTDMTDNKAVIQNAQTEKTEEKSISGESEKVENQSKNETAEKSEKTDNQNEDKKIKNSDEKNVKQSDSEKQTVENKEKNDSSSVMLERNKPADVSKKEVSDNKDAKKIKTDKKLENELNRMSELIDEDSKNISSDEVLQTAAAANLDNAKNAKGIPEHKDTLNELKIDSENIASDSESSLPSFEKISYLDKDEKIIVRDQRTQIVDENQNSKNTNKFNTTIQMNDDNTATITMDMAGQNSEANMLALNNQTAASNGSDFQAMLNNQLQVSTPDFVQTGSLLLKNNDKGTINLVLHPDDLGNVKIQLSMDGKTVSAHITVNTKEALEVFKDNAQTLREAFAKNGFDTANFDVSYNGGSNSQNQNSHEFSGGNEYIARQAYSEFSNTNDGYSQNEIEYVNNSDYSINIVA